MINGRKIVVTGHYGSGKTEFSVSLAMKLCNNGKIALIDLDIVNPYFRSREQRKLLEDAGVAVYGSVFDEETTVELPALGASLRAPLEDNACRVIIDVGGNDTGALILNQFTKYLTDEETAVLTIINANRPDTDSVNKAIKHITAIENATGLAITGVVNNTHLLRETTVSDVIYGHGFCLKICEMTGKQLVCDCYPDGLVNPNELTGLSENILPLGLYMRPTWLDK